ncbi:hypothetical protein GOODEAATRI_013590 [Goodea atripinnis]|uniref:Uncharacterized protein n=1 Tax=Goodea atripinnis TaxID=208336 RepID=A0ABV0N377_9TELE
MPIWSPHGRVTMTITFFCSQPVFILAVAVLLCPVSQVTCQEEGELQSPAQVLQDLLARYGDNSTITKLCPTMLQQLDAGTCKVKKGDELSPDPSLRPSDAEALAIGTLYSNALFQLIPEVELLLLWFT